MKHLDLFSGIGGFALAAQTVWGDEYENIGFCEINKFCQAVLRKNFGKDITIYEDIRTLTNTTRTGSRTSPSEINKFREKVIKERKEQSQFEFSGCDLLTGGFPCQPFSQAGKRKGTDDDRYLWPEMLRVIKEFKPRWIIGENVSGLLTMAQFEGNTTMGSETDLFGNKTHTRSEYGRGILYGIINDLESIGYSVQPLIIPACAVNAPHRRDRIWIIGYSQYGRREEVSEIQKDNTNTTRSNGIIAHAQSSGHGGSAGKECRVQERKLEQDEQERSTLRGKDQGCCGDITNPTGQGLQKRKEKNRTQVYSTKRNCSEISQQFPSWTEDWTEVATALCGVFNGFSDWMDRYFDLIITEEFYATSFNKNKAKDLPILRKEIQKEEIWQKLGRLFKVESPEILLSFLCRIQEATDQQNNIQHKSQKNESENSLQKLWQSAEFMRSPQRRQYQEQLAQELKNIMPELSYETTLGIAKAWDYLQCGYSSMISHSVELDGFKLTAATHRVERLKALGNAIVPQVAIEIMRAIKQVDNELIL